MAKDARGISVAPLSDFNVSSRLVRTGGTSRSILLSLGLMDTYVYTCSRTPGLLRLDRYTTKRHACFIFIPGRKYNEWLCVMSIISYGPIIRGLKARASRLVRCGGKRLRAGVTLLGRELHHMGGAVAMFDQAAGTYYSGEHETIVTAVLGGMAWCGAKLRSIRTPALRHLMQAPSVALVAVDCSAMAGATTQDSPG